MAIETHNTRAVSGLLIGYARVFDEQDLIAQRDALTGLGVAPERIYVNEGLSGHDAFAHPRDPAG